MTAFKRPSLWKDIKENPKHWRTLIGTGGSWLLYDFLYYGLSLNQPQIIENAFGASDSAFSVLGQNLIAAAVGVPGVVLAIVALPRLGAKALQAYGFILLTMICGGMATVMFLDPMSNSSGVGASTPTSAWLQFGMLCALIFGLNWGPNVSGIPGTVECFAL